MLKISLSKEELQQRILDKVYLSDIQERIIVYRMKDLSIVQMADLEHCSPSKINKEIHELKCKLKEIL
jgi:hypothetical protein